MFNFIVEFKATLARVEAKIEAVLHQLEGKVTTEVKTVEEKAIVEATPTTVVTAVEDQAPKA